MWEWREYKLSQLKEAYIGIRCPQGQVVTQELHDQSAVLVGFFTQAIQL
jgi:hypothetical protein